MTTSLEVRDSLIRALQIDLVGPTPKDTSYQHEILTQAPSKWYLTGFIVPYGSPLEKASDDTGDEVLDELVGNSANEDNAVPDITAARKVPFPSSMGLSFLVKQEVASIQAVISWGDYHPIELEDELVHESEEVSEEEKSNKAKKKIGWQRVPHCVEVTIPLNHGKKQSEIAVPESNGLKLVVYNREVHSSLFSESIRSVSVFLVNHRAMRGDVKDEFFAFQTCLTLKSEDTFFPRSNPRGQGSSDWDEAVANLQYRDDCEYAVGHNVSAVYTPVCGTCTEIRTSWVPISEVPRVAPAGIDGVTFGMETLGNISDSKTLQEKLSPLVSEYAKWINEQSIEHLPSEEAKTARKLLSKADFIRKRIEKGIAALDDANVFEAFKIANRAVALSRRQQLIIENEGDTPSEFETVGWEPQWRPFQLAFILLNLQCIAFPEDSDRETVDLLFFPTGGGKTEAYLGLAAYTLALRRLTYPGIQSAGVSVLMRYTLRLLTLDQLERATRVICALEIEREKNPRLSSHPFEIGLWVGQGATPNKMGRKGDKDEYSALAKTNAFRRDETGKPSPIPLERCPWCGERFKARSFQLLGADLTPNADEPKDLRVICSNRKCLFRSDRPLPIVTVDEPIYRRLPCFIIATVDKFANLPWIGKTAAFFGKVTHYEEGIGFYSAAEPHRGRSLEHPLPPPDLVIQDELHLISGPLGTMVGLYETAIDALCTREEKGVRIRPKIIASTATVRRADHQIRALFDRSQVDIFPPPGPDRHDSFFAETVSVHKVPGRLYIGVAAQGRSPKVLLLRTYLALLAAAQKAWEASGGAKNPENPADPYMTLLGYFNSLRELGGSRRIVEDEVNSRLTKYGGRLRYEEEEGVFADRTIADVPEELTSRVPTNKIANTKRCLSVSFHQKEKVDVALATNMISVGLDITRLGLMVVLGQPKTAAEYIQATSRVGRDVRKPGLVVTLMNIHRHRDRSHYERFQAWHESFYRAVEATSVTPFSPRALDRGLAGVTVALARLGLPKMTPPLGASYISEQRAALEFVVDTIARRAEAHNPENSGAKSETLRQEIRLQIKDLFDTWKRIAENETRLQYQKEIDLVTPLLLDANDINADNEPAERQKFKAQRSLRDVEPTVNLFVRDPAGLVIEEEAE